MILQNLEYGFPAGIRIATKHGLVPIEQIQKGDLVLTQSDSGQGEPYYQPVDQIFYTEDEEIWQLDYFEVKANTDLTKLHKGKLLQLSHKGKLKGALASSKALLWVKDLGWTPLGELKNGQIIQTKSSEIEALVFMVNPLRETTLANSAGSYHVRNLLDADRKGFDLPDDDYFDLFEFNDHGLCAILAEDSISPLKANGQEVHVLSTTFKRTIYNLKVKERSNFYTFSNGLLVKGI
ncbi:hypothetical protein [Acinetobacter sp.]|jgi:hypothetical protein|uniref:hypothetical protein n=1 Tax=Acinetobacter sp. TaxID=472 RepID=UPI0035B290CB